MRDSPAERGIGVEERRREHVPRRSRNHNSSKHPVAELRWFSVGRTPLSRPPNQLL